MIKQPAQVQHRLYQLTRPCQAPELGCAKPTDGISVSVTAHPKQEGGEEIET